MYNFRCWFDFTFYAHALGSSFNSSWLSPNLMFVSSQLYFGFNTKDVNWGIKKTLRSNIGFKVCLFKNIYSAWSAHILLTVYCVSKLQIFYNEGNGYKRHITYIAYYLDLISEFFLRKLIAAAGACILAILKMVTTKTDKKATLQD